MLTASFQRFSDEQAPVHSAAIAYSMVFSLPPILLIILWAAGLISKESPVRNAIAGELGALVGASGAQEMMATMEGLVIEEPTWWATAIAAATLVFTASTVLVAGQGALNRITSKHLDFVLAIPGSMIIVCAIELDDASHRRQDRVDRDEFVDGALAYADVPLIRFEVQPIYSVEEIRDSVADALSDTRELKEPRLFL